jgi:hypothetical protein
MVWRGFTWLKIQNVGVCEHGNEHSDSMKIGNFFTISFSKCIPILVLLLRSVELFHV